MVNLHLPMLEGALITALPLRVPVVTTYHIDLWLPPTLVTRAAMAAVRVSSRVTLRRSDAVVVNSDDQARYSELWSILRSSQRSAIPAPCLDRRGGEAAYRETAGPHIGFLGRIVPDKGLDYLVAAFAEIPDPEARLLLGGDYLTVAGGSVIDRIRRPPNGIPGSGFSGCSVAGRSTISTPPSTPSPCPPSPSPSASRRPRR